MKSASQYFNAKLDLLTDLQNCSESIMTALNLDEWETYDELGDRRNEIIDKLNALEAANRAEFDPQLTKEQKQQINSKVALILAFEQDVVKRIEEEKEIAIKGMETEKHEENILQGYQLGGNQVTGVYLDTKR